MKNIKIKKENYLITYAKEYVFYNHCENYEINQMITMSNYKIHRNWKKVKEKIKISGFMINTKKYFHKNYLELQWIVNIDMISTKNAK